MSTILEAEVLSKAFRAGKGGWAGGVRSIDLEVRTGETLALVGESGAGKSTLGRLLLDLIKPDSGTVRFLGNDIARLSRADRKRFRAQARMVFQDPFTSLDPRLHIGAAVSQPLIVHRLVARDEREDRIADLLTSVGLPAAVATRFPYELSGGQLQRVALARALATQPSLVVCDEPVSALDMSVRAHVINLMRAIQAESGVAYVFISHDLSLVRLIADRVIVLFNGEVVEAGSCTEVFEDPKAAYTRELLAAVPVPGRGRRRDRATAPAI